MSNAQLSQEQLNSVLKGILALQHFDFAARVRDDLDYAGKMEPGEREAFFAHRVHMTRVFQGLNEIAAEFGALSSFIKHMEIYLEARGFSDAEIQAIAARIDKGFAQAAYQWKSKAGTPSEGEVVRRMRENGVAPTAKNGRRCSEELARGRATIQEHYSAVYKKAKGGDLEASRKELLPRLPLTYNTADPDRPLRTYEAADRIERGEFFAMLVDGNVVLAPDFASAFAAAAENRTIDDDHRIPRDASAAKSSKLAAATPYQDALPQSEVPDAAETRTAGTPELNRRADQSVPRPVDASQPESEESSASGEPTSSEHIVIARAADDAGNVAREPGKVETLSELCEAMLTRLQIRDPKRQRQYRGTAELLQTVAGTDKCSAIKESDLEAFRDLLDLLSPTFGKSPADRRKSLAQLEAEGRALPPNMRGLQPGTINRRMGEVRALIKFARKKGFKWVSADFEVEHVRDPEAAKNKRERFSDNHLTQLFTHLTWSDTQKSVWPSVYFVPILSLYGLVRREEIVGLQYRDVYISSREIHIRPNSNRRLKNGESDRVIPIPEEAIRLGFLEYLGTLSDDPFGDVFPEIKEAAPNTKMGDTFYKRWAPILQEAIPDAKEAKLVFHSFRHTGIDIFVNMPRVPEEIRRGLSGHAQKGVDVTVYLKKITSQSMRRIMKKYPLFTSHIQLRDWKKRRQHAQSRRA